MQANTVCMHAVTNYKYSSGASAVFVIAAHVDKQVKMMSSL
jgi:hypothetical protein